MTVSYNLDVSSSSTFSFIRILFRWRGSIWKSVKSELLLWTCGYYSVFVIYRYLLSQDQQNIFAKWGQELDKKLNYIPLTFMLGFFVTVIVDRWRQIFQNMGWIEKFVFKSLFLIKTIFPVLLWPFPWWSKEKTKKRSFNEGQSSDTWSFPRFFSSFTPENFS